MAQASNIQDKQGYTQPDNAVRCKKCCIGTTQTGESIGALLVAHNISCQMSDGSVLVATMARCSKKEDDFYRDGVKMPNCGAIYNLKLTPMAEQMGLLKANILRCVRRSHGNLFTLDELKNGIISLAKYPKELEPIGEPPVPINYNADEYIEQNIF